MGKILVIAEKPSAGRDIARILGVKEDKGAYMENADYVVSWAIGHLVELKDPEDIDERYKQWNATDIPLPADNGLKIKDSGRAQFKVLKELIARNDIEYLINAGDAGREGLLIQSWIYRMAGNRHPVKILWSSSLTDEAIKDAMRNLHDEDEDEFKNLLVEAETRAVADQVYGYNYTRLLTCLFADHKVLSYGRCQTPLLNLIVKRDLENEKFKSQPYWSIAVSYEEGFGAAETDNDGKSIKYMKKEAAEAAAAMCGSAGKAIVKSCVKEKKSSKAPALFNLAELQSTMGRKYGYAPDKTLGLAQSLYEKHKILSYPRTDSRYLSTDLYNEISEHVQCCRFGKFKEYVDHIDYSAFAMDKSYFNNNKVSDHHALIPTINNRMPDIYADLTAEEQNLFDEVAVSLIAIFYPAYEYEATEVIAVIGDKSFRSNGNILIASGYKEVYSLLNDKGEEKKPGQGQNPDQSIPNLKEGMELSIESVALKEDKTRPPARYSPGNIIKLMGKYKIGTSATSAGIVQNLIDRGFLKLEKNKYVSTELGRKLLLFIPDVLKSPEMTLRFEEKLQKVHSGEISKDEFINDIKSEIEVNKQNFIKNIPEEKLGAPASIGTCPVCDRKIKEGRKGWYCEGYNQNPKCSFAIWKEIAGKKIPESAAKKLAAGKRTDLIKGFTGKSGKNFDAYLILHKDSDGNFKTAFEFPAGKGGK